MGINQSIVQSRAVAKALWRVGDLAKDDRNFGLVS